METRWLVLVAVFTAVLAMGVERCESAKAFDKVMEGDGK